MKSEKFSFFFFCHRLCQTCHNITHNKKKYIKLLVISNKNRGFYSLIKRKNYHEIIIHPTCRIPTNFKTSDSFNDTPSLSIHGVNSCTFIWKNFVNSKKVIKVFKKISFEVYMNTLVYFFNRIGLILTR